MMPEKMRVLIVEDEEGMRQLLVHCFGCSSNGSYAFDVTAVASPNEAAQLFASDQQFDIGIIDLGYQSAVNDRHEFGHQIVFAASFMCPNGIIVVYTALADPPNVVRAMKLGATEVVSKRDYPPDNLVDLVVGLLNESKDLERQRQIMNRFILEHHSEWCSTKPGMVLAIAVNSDGPVIATEGPTRLDVLLNYERQRHLFGGQEWPVDPLLCTIPQSSGDPSSCHRL